MPRVVRGLSLSGADETVLFRMAGDKIDNLRSLAEPSDVAPLFPAEASAAPAAEKSRIPLGVGMIGLALSLLAAFTPRLRQVMLIVAIAAVGGGVYLGLRDQHPPAPSTTVVKKLDYPR